jgi:hypothetical protein
MPVTLESIRNQPDRATYTNGGKPLAVLVEGAFQSAYSNRVKPLVLEGTHDEGPENMMLVVADGDVIRNQLRNGRPLELGYDKWTNNFYGNKEFLVYIHLKSLHSFPTQEHILRVSLKLTCIQTGFHNSGMTLTKGWELLLGSIFYSFTTLYSKPNKPLISKIYAFMNNLQKTIVTEPRDTTQHVKIIVITRLSKKFGLQKLSIPIQVLFISKNHFFRSKNASYSVFHSI